MQGANTPKPQSSSRHGAYKRQALQLSMTRRGSSALSEGEAFNSRYASLDKADSICITSRPRRGSSAFLSKALSPRRLQILDIVLNARNAKQALINKNNYVVKIPRVRMGELSFAKIETLENHSLFARLINKVDN